jgi:hypothetical protein
MHKLIVSAAILLALIGSADAGLTKRAQTPRLLNSYLLSGWCTDLPFRDEDAQLRANYYQAYSDGLCTMFVTFGIDISRGDGAVAANYCLPSDVKYLTIAQDFALLLRRSPEAREADPLEVLINLMEVKYPCDAK